MPESTRISTISRRRGIPRAAKVSKDPARLTVRDWRALLHHHPNMLLEGNESNLEETLVALEQDFYPRRLSWVEDAVPPDPGAHTTVIVREIAKLPALRRDGLYRWLTTASRPIQIVSTSSIPLFPLVERNEFPADLYYRLNIVRVTVG